MVPVKVDYDLSFVYLLTQDQYNLVMISGIFPEELEKLQSRISDLILRGKGTEQDGIVKLITHKCHIKLETGYFTKFSGKASDFFSWKEAFREAMLRKELTYLLDDAERVERIRKKKAKKNLIRNKKKVIETNKNNK